MIDTPKITTLSNGLRICFIPHRGVQSATIHLKGNAGSIFEKPDEIGAAHMLEHWALQGTKNYPDQSKLVNLVTSAGGKIVAVTSRDTILFMTKTINTQIERGLEFLSEVFQYPLLTEDSLATQKEIVKHEILRYRDIPEKLIGRLSYKIMFPGHRLEKLNTGDIEDIEEISQEKVKNFRERIYTGNNFCICVCGSFDEDKVFEWINERFGNVKSGKINEFERISKDNNLDIQVYGRKDSERAHIMLSYHGYKLSNVKRVPAQYLAKILNNSLNNEVKIQKGFAYNTSCTSSYTGNFGIFALYSATSKEHILDIIREFRKSLENIKNSLAERHIEKTKNQLISDLIFDFEKTSLRTEFFSEHVLYGDPGDTHVTELEKIKRTKASDVLSVAEEISKQNPKITVISSGVEEPQIRNYWEQSI